MQEISLGLAHHQAGRLADAESIYRQILRADSNHPEALHWLGVIAHQMGNNKAALELIIKAISISPLVPRYHSHLGLVYKGLKRLDEALTSFQQAINMCPDFAEAYNNIGNVFQEQSKFHDAMLSYQKALTINPRLVEPVKNIGDLFKIQGMPSEALAHYKKTQSIAPDSFSAHNAALTSAILYYLENDLRGARAELDSAKKMSVGISRATVASQTYWHYMDYLLTWWATERSHVSQDSTVKPLNVIGESHSLSLQNISVSINDRCYRGQANWIEGCKQWHLANGDNNIYKYQVSRVIKSLPSNATALLTIGEIDCRHNEGIFSRWRKLKGNIHEAIDSTVNGYLNYVYPLAMANNVNLIISGVPATNALRDDLPKEIAWQFGCFLSDFNDVLKKSSLKLGFSFLDVFSLTNAGSGFADGTCHLDSHHLHPDAMKSAFVDHLIIG